MMQKIATFGLAAMLAGCVPVVDDSSTPPVFADNREEPELALIEHVLAAYFASDITNRPTVCVAVNDGREASALAMDEEVTLMQRFGQLAPMARCASGPAGWRDAETEQPALVHTLHSFTCTSADRCSGWAGYQAGASSSMSYLYTMEWHGRAWAFTRDARAIAQ